MTDNRRGMNKFIVCLMGPTACGKTSLGIKLARALNTEIISVDSALVYRGMDIGTAKPDEQEREGIVHHLIDIRDPAESYSAADFRQDALRLIEDIQSRGKIPLLVGGTMLYFKALLSGISDLPASDPAVREMLYNREKNEGLTALHEELCKIDPVAGTRIMPGDEQRILRALEVYIISGKSMTELISQGEGNAFSQPALQLALIPEEREVIRERIRQRFDDMLTAGFENEVRKLFQRPDLNENLSSIRAVGYRQCWQFLKGDISREEMIFRAVVATCQLAKHQTTWLRGWKFPLIKLNPLDEDNLQVALREIAKIASGDYSRNRHF